MKWEKVVTLVLLAVIAAAAAVIAVRGSKEGRYDIVNSPRGFLLDRKTGATWRWVNVGDLDGDRENDYGWQLAPKDQVGTQYTRVRLDPEE